MYGLLRLEERGGLLRSIAVKHTEGKRDIFGYTTDARIVQRISSNSEAYIPVDDSVCALMLCIGSTIHLIASHSRYDKRILDFSDQDLNELSCKIGLEKSGLFSTVESIGNLPDNRRWSANRLTNEHLYGIASVMIGQGAVTERVITSLIY